MHATTIKEEQGEIGADGTGTKAGHSEDIQEGKQERAEDEGMAIKSEEVAGEDVRTRGSSGTEGAKVTVEAAAGGAVTRTGQQQPVSRDAELARILAEIAKIRVNVHLQDDRLNNLEMKVRIFQAAGSTVSAG